MLGYKYRSWTGVLANSIYQVPAPAHEKVMSGRKVFVMDNLPQKPTWVDKALIIAAFTFVFWALFFLPGKAASPEHEILITFCSAASGCVEHRWPLEKEVTPYQCFHYAQPLAVEWIEQHPDFQVKAMGCGRRSYPI